MTPDSIILLTPEARLDALLYALESSRLRVRDATAWQAREDAWDACTAAWEAVHGELMHQLKGKA